MNAKVIRFPRLQRTPLAGANLSRTSVCKRSMLQSVDLHILQRATVDAVTRRVYPAPSEHHGTAPRTRYAYASRRRIAFSHLRPKGPRPSAFDTRIGLVVRQTARRNNRAAVMGGSYVNIMRIMMRRAKKTMRLRASA